MIPAAALTTKIEKGEGKEKETKENQKALDYTKLGYNYLHGKEGVEKDLRKAYFHFKLAADLGQVESQYNVSGLLQDHGMELAKKCGIKDEKQYLEAIAKYLTLSADAEYPTATFRLGVCYFEGRFGFKKDEKRGFELFLKSAEHNLDSEFNVASCIFYGIGTPKNVEEGIKRLTAAQIKGHPIAHRILGWCYETGTGVQKDYKKSVELYEAAIKLGINQAKVYVGRLYLSREYGVQNIQKGSDYLHSAALEGDAQAMYILGCQYFEGNGIISRDRKKAFEYFKYVSEKGNNELAGNAELRMAKCYLEGEGVAKDDSWGVFYLERAVGKDNVDALVYLGSCYMRGLGVPKDETKAFLLFRAAAERGNTVALHDLGIAHMKGEGVPKDEKTAIIYFEMAANRGDLEATCSLANFYLIGKEVEQDFKKAVTMYESILKKNPNHANALLRMGQCYLEGKGVEKDEKKGFELVTKAESLNSGHACLLLATCYKNAWGTERNFEKAYQYFEKAASRQVVEGFLMMGAFCLNGLGTAKNVKKAIEYFQLAANTKDANALNVLGVCYLNGWANKNKKPEVDKAIKLFEESLALRSLEAENNLGWCYLNGIGVPQDEKRAYEYFESSRTKGNIVSENNLGWMYLNGLGVSKDRYKAERRFKFRDLKVSSKEKIPLFIESFGLSYLGFWSVDPTEALRSTTKKESKSEKDMNAQFNLALCYLKGWGVKSDPIKGFEILSALSKTHGPARFSLALCYIQGLGIEKDEQKGLKLLEKEAEHSLEASFELALCLQKGTGGKQDFNKAGQLLLECASKRYLEAEFQLALCFREGLGVFPKSPEKAFEYFQKAANDGHPAATRYLADCFEKGFGVDKNLNYALTFYEWAAEMGDGEAQNNFGTFIEQGIQRDKDPVTAAHYYWNAAVNGSPHGMANLARCYELGIGREKNKEAAIKWYKKAADLGNLSAKKYLLELTQTEMKKIKEKEQKEKDETKAALEASKPIIEEPLIAEKVTKPKVILPKYALQIASKSHKTVHTNILLNGRNIKTTILSGGMLKR